ncbi:MAG: hypothetical protein OJF49_003804 [Ktedonobacterales bacterium]|nr:MAG: hypothetical protein OJF49_003804 [Ktedonobacterales bacterium]
MSAAEWPQAIQARFQPPASATRATHSPRMRYTVRRAARR